MRYILSFVYSVVILRMVKTLVVDISKGAYFESKSLLENCQHQVSKLFLVAPLFQKEVLQLVQKEGFIGPHVIALPKVILC